MTMTRASAPRLCQVRERRPSRTRVLFPSAAFTTISPQETGRATVIFTSLRQLGSAVGVAAVTTALVTASGHTPQQAGLRGHHVAFATAAVIALMAAAAAATRRPHA
jgi:hypothetical protein